jgi:NAD(P)H-hydrate epimerase
MSLPTALYSVAQVRAFDAHAIRVLGIPGYTLMQRAAAAALRLLRGRWPGAQRIAVVCGAGNNGGDGYVLARLLRDGGSAVSLQALVPVAGLKGDALHAAQDFLASGGVIEAFNAARLAEVDVVVDALLGTGFHAPLRAAFAGAIAAINGASRPVLALDLPSGINGDTGEAAGGAVRAAATISFVALKQGLVLNGAPEYVGDLSCDDLQVVLPTGNAALPAITALNDADLFAALPPRRADANKGNFGRVLIIGSGEGMPGAVRLAGEACLRAGAGLVTVASLPEHVTGIVADRPELMCVGVRSAAELAPLLAAADVVAIGPGLGRSEWAASLLAATLQCARPLVIDADALNLIAAGALTVPSQAVITPHPGEAARLLHCATAEVQRDRLAALRRLVALTGAVTVLKGRGTLVGASDCVPAICREGNPGMATAGMGDVLTGAIAGVLAQCRDPWLAARAGVLAHARAGDAEADRVGARGLLALEVAARLTACLNQHTP